MTLARSRPLAFQPPRLACMLSVEMKLLVEIVLAIFLHPIIFILCWINILTRSDLSGLKKLLWILITVLWGIGPILYLLLADGSFW